jgi:rare lipoprotein A
MGSNIFKRAVAAGVACGTVAAAAGGPAAQAAPQPASRPESAREHAAPHPAKPRLDLSGRTRVGKASFYSAKFNGRRMADGSPMDPRSDSAASKTLPLGTTAKVTNLKTGESAVVTIRDRGPHVRGRIVDLSPAAARKVGIDRHEGVSQVAVTPLSLPPSGPGANAPGAAAGTQAREPRGDSAASPK